MARVNVRRVTHEGAPAVTGLSYEAQLRRTVCACLLWENSIPEPNSGCWIWLRSLTKAGYGQLTLDGKICYAHRESFKTYKGPIPEGYEVCHHCDFPPCINPDHLFIGTHADNFADASRKERLPGLKGTASPVAKLTDEQVLAIRSDPRSHRTIGRDYNISNRNVSAIKRRETWSHLP